MVKPGYMSMRYLDIEVNIY